jgi:hypothetical protein
VTQDHIFDPWSLDEPLAASEPPDPSIEAPPTSGLAGLDGAGAAELLRRMAVGRLEAIGARLRVGRHVTSLEDLLDGPARLLRFVLTPWPGPLPLSGPNPSAMLEIGLGGDSDDLVTAWYWLDPASEAPDRVASVPSSKLTAGWLERIILDFVGRALERD